MRTCLIAVDMQNDFLPGGAIPVEDGDQIIDPLVKLAKAVDLVIASRDWHPSDHCSFDTYTPHCIQDTAGARIGALHHQQGHR